MDFLEETFNKNMQNNAIDHQLFDQYNVKIGLRNHDGRGVLVGLTKISDVYGYYMDKDKKIDDEGHLIIRGYDLYDIAKMDHDNYGYEKVAYLILFGKWPTNDEAYEFIKVIKDNYKLPKFFMEDVLLKNPSNNLMNHLQRAILSLYSYDNNPDDTEPIMVLKKGLSILAKMPTIINYVYQSNRHFLHNDSLILRQPNQNMSIAENILYLLKGENNYQKEEVDILDLCLIIHADHGGAPNSTFVDEVISSTGTDLYSSISGSLAALKGPRHGGANIEVTKMMKAIINHIGLDASKEQISDVLNKILNKDFYNNSGLIYGIGHAVYTKSDPRAVLLKQQCKKLAYLKNKEKLFNFYSLVEDIAIKELKKRKGNSFNCCANLDFYSGLAYQFLGIPEDLYTPIFATSRMIGWLAHDIENKLYCNKIVRPATKYVGEINKEDLK